MGYEEREGLQPSHLPHAQLKSRKRMHGLPRGLLSVNVPSKLKPPSEDRLPCAFATIMCLAPKLVAKMLPPRSVLIANNKFLTMSSKTT